MGEKKKKVAVLGIRIITAANLDLFRSAILLKPTSYFIIAFLAFLKISGCCLRRPMSQTHPEGSPTGSPTETDKSWENSGSKSAQARGTQSRGVPGRKFRAAEEGAELSHPTFVGIQRTHACPCQPQGFSALLGGS